MASLLAHDRPATLRLPLAAVSFASSFALVNRTKIPRSIYGSSAVFFDAREEYRGHEVTGCVCTVDGNDRRIPCPSRRGCKSQALGLVGLVLLFILSLLLVFLLRSAQAKALHAQDSHTALLSVLSPKRCAVQR